MQTRQPDKFALIAGGFAVAQAPFRLPVDALWPELLRKTEDGWERLPVEGFGVFELMRISQARRYTRPFWLTLRDGLQARASLSSEAVGVTIPQWKWAQKAGDWKGDISPQNAGDILSASDLSDEADQVVAMRPVVVFNADEWDRIDALPACQPREVPTKEEALERARKVEEQGVGCEIRHEGEVAYYNPSLNYICLPPKDKVGDKAYYWMLFEQMGHAVASRHQLDLWKDEPEATIAKEDPSTRVLYAKMVAARLAYETGIDVLE
jgi:antirestriction protein ArdC